MPPADVPFYLPEQTVPEDAHMVLLAGGHPKKTSVIWKEVVIYKDFGACHVFGIEACGRRKYRTLEMATDCRFCHWELQPDSRLPGYDDMQFQRNPMEPWPAWGRHLAVAFTSALDDDEEDYRDWLRGVQPPPFGPSVVIQRPVQSVRGKPTLSAEEAEARVKAAEKPEDARAPPARKGAWDRPAVKDMEVAKLLTGIPHSVILCAARLQRDELQALHVLVPQNLPMRPNLRIPKSLILCRPQVFERLGKWGKKWASKAKVTYFKYEVHVSKGFLIAPSFSSAMYLLLLRFLARDYGGVCSLVHAVGTDAPLNEEEAQILQVLGLVEDAHPDALACRCLVTLAVQRSGCPLHWDFRQEFAWYASTCPSLQAMTGDLALGYACCLIASVAYAVNYLPVKKYETGDGVFFTFAMSLGILVVGLLMGFMQHEPLHFEPLAAVGGVIFTLGNLLCPLVIQLIGLGLGLTMWDLSNMLMGWLTGHFGLFGVDPEISHKPLFNYSGLALACLSLVFMYLAARFDTTPKEADVEAPDEKARELPEVSSPNPLRLLLGSSLAVLAGALFGTMFDLPQDLMQGNFGPCHSLCALDYVFSHFLGIFAAAAAALLSYIAVQRRMSYLPLNLVLPAMCSGIIWAIGTVAWFQANGELGFSVTFPIISSLPSILALLIGFCCFDELQSSKSRAFALMGVMIRLPGVALIALSRLEQEAELLEECDRLNSKYRVVEAQTKKVPARERNQILALFLDPEDAKAAAASEMQKLQDLKSGILSGMRAEGLSCNEVEMRRLVGTIQERRHELPAWMKHCLENRQELLKARGYKISEKDDGKKKDKDKNEKAKEVKDEVTLKVPKPTDDARAKWIVHCNRNVLKDSMVSSASLEECNTKTYATRPALEWALLNLHGDVSLDEMFVLLYRLFTGQTKLKMGPPGSTEEDTRRWAHTYATLVAYMQPEALEGGFLASFLNVFAHNFDEVLVDPNMPKPPGNDAYRQKHRRTCKDDEVCQEELNRYRELTGKSMARGRGHSSILGRDTQELHLGYYKHLVAYLLEHGLVTEVPVKILDAASKANFRSFYKQLETATTSRKLGYSPDSVDTMTQTCT
ncbi:unnamed protein product [Effrenium voratum]|nr:unnamed protein product [Effrenium voratum]